MKSFTLKLTAAALLLASPVAAADQVTVMFDWIPSGWHAAWYAGQHNGCFADQNLEVTLERGSGGSDTVAKVAARQADIGMAELGTVLIGAQRNGAAIKAIMPVYQDSPFGILSPSDSGIDSLVDLEGKKIAAGPGDSNIQFLPEAMRLSGGDFAKVDVVNADFSALLGLLLQGRVDGFTTFATTAGTLKSIAADAGKPLDFYHYGKELNIYGSVLFANDQFLESRPDVAKRLVAGAECSYEAARKDPDATLAAFLAVFPERKPAAEMAGIQSGIMLTFDNETYGRNGFGFDLDRVRRSQQLAFAAQGITDVHRDAADFVETWK